MRAVLVALVLWGLGCWESPKPHQEAAIDPPVRVKAGSVTNGQGDKPDKTAWPGEKTSLSIEKGNAVWAEDDAEWDRIHREECQDCVDGPKREPGACQGRCELNQLPLDRVLVTGCVCGGKRFDWDRSHCSNGSIGCERYGFKAVVSPDGLFMRWTR